ncbi:hypothetical protein [Roseateles puraquae]|uniref:Uncharacterized protein n=1 Tax=Roseateles puraquae TaxID=431059 RepID=A0A254N412_9BURK|nr:hypothetical protein [Roseateles puraquae]MDG0856367.1 hypothetical protein [Roseateles puraquae]OWR02404.1 hypothetical protein CDO81_19640 [Roseateles puraquae]
MNMTQLTRARQELVSMPFAVPGGRLVTARLILLPSMPAGPMPREPHTLQLAVDVRATRDGDFEEVASSEVVPQFGERIVDVAVPTPAEPLEAGQLPAMARLRLIHTGQTQPIYELRLIGL